MFRGLIPYRVLLNLSVSPPHMKAVDLIVHCTTVLYTITNKMLEILLSSFLSDSSTPESKHSLIYGGVCQVVLPSGVFVGFLAVLWMWFMRSACCAKHVQW